jgi:glycine/D-amino acid oxidase-like deaminating enzyme
MTSHVSRMNAVDVVVIGGGIAGLAAAYHLSGTPGLSVLLLEREPVLASHSSGRNAAIFRPLEARPEIVALAARSVQLLDALMGSSRRDWLEQKGVLLVASDATALSELAALATGHGIRHGMVQGRDLERLVPVLAGGDATKGLWLPDAGVVDIHAVVTRLATRVRAAGAMITTGCEVARVRASGGRVEGVELTSGDVIAAPAVVIAAGAWAVSLGASCMAEVPLTPLRRHLVRLDIAASLPPSTPVVWRLDDEVYFREESGGVLASPAMKILGRRACRRATRAHSRSLPRNLAASRRDSALPPFVRLGPASGPSRRTGCRWRERIRQ